MTSPATQGPRHPHAVHDLEAIAAFAAGDTSAKDTARIETIIEACPTCALLVDDLRALAAATRHLPARSLAPRDFRLSAAAAAGLRGGRWGRVRESLGLSQSSLRPFAAMCTTLGIAGLLLATLPFMSLGSTSGDAGPQRPSAGATGGAKVVVDASGPEHARSPEATATFGAPPAPADNGSGSGGSRQSNVPAYVASSPAATPTRTQESAIAPNPVAATPLPERALPLALLSLGLILLGIALFVVARRTARGR